MRAISIVPVVVVAQAQPGGAHAATTCDSRAKLERGALSRLTDDKHVESGATIDRGDPFHADSAAKIRFQDVVYKLRRGSEFMLACFGHTVKQGAIYPRLSLHTGHARLIARAGAPGAISTNEAMADPFADRAMRITVRRAPRPSNPLFGKTTVDRLTGDGYVNLTPYVGERPGTCRQVDGGKLVSKKLVDGYFKGTARYRGYAPGSPR